MKKIAICAMAILLVGFMTAAAWSGNHKHQETFTAPDGVKTQHNTSVDSHFFAPNTWVASVTETPPAPGLKKTRDIETYERSLRYANKDPKCNNFKEYLTDKITENRDHTHYDEVFTKVVHANSGAKQAVGTLAVGGFFQGLGYGLGNSLPNFFGPINKITNTLINAPGPVTATGTGYGGAGGAGGAASSSSAASAAAAAAAAAQGGGGGQHGGGCD